MRNGDDVGEKFEQKNPGDESIKQHNAATRRQIYDACPALLIRAGSIVGSKTLGGFAHLFVYVFYQLIVDIARPE